MSEYFKRRFGEFWEMEKHGYNENPEKTPRPPPPPILKRKHHSASSVSNAPKSDRKRNSSSGIE